MSDQTQIVGYLKEKDITKRLDIHKRFYLLLLVKYKVRQELNNIALQILLNGLINLSKGSGGGLQSLNPLFPSFMVKPLFTRFGVVFGSPTKRGLSLV